MRTKQKRKNTIPYTLIMACFFLFLLQSAALGQQAIRVHSLGELKMAVADFQPGTEIFLADGLYMGEMVLETGKGTKNHPIIIRAENQGKAVIGSPIILKGNHIAFIGCRFQEQGNITIEGKNCRLSRCTFSDSKATKWVRVLPGSSRIEIDHNLFENKNINRTARSCQLMQIIVLNQNEQHHIHHNLFRDIPEGNGNGYETLQLITRGNPFDPPPGDCHTLIEQNLFIRCNGEPEVISVKSNGNLIRGNTFRACRGSLVFRHGDNNVAIQNSFFGDGEPGSGGVRLQGTDQVAANNFFHGLGQFGIGMMDGTPDDLYIRVERANILFNTFINCGNTMVIGINHPRHPNGTTPKDCLIAGNIYYNVNEQPLVEYIQDDQPENWTWEDNVAFGATTRMNMTGISEINPHLDIQESGLAYPTDETPFVNSDLYKNELLNADLLGQERKDNRTLGAIQFPVRDKKMGILTEEMVGPVAE